MKGRPRLIVTGLLMFAACCLWGCGGTGTATDQSAPIAPVAEYVGDGHHGTKPVLGFGGLGAVLAQPQAMAELLGIGGRPITSTVLATHTNWFRLPKLTTSTLTVVMLQPTADEDADLYLLKGNGGTYAGGAGSLGHSNRLPTGGDAVNGFAPDWVARNFAPTAGYPAAQVAVYGAPGGPATKHFYLEADPVTDLVPNGADSTRMITAGYSDWYRVTSGAIPLDVSVHLNQMSTETSLFLYKNDALGFLISTPADLPTGQISVGFHCDPGDAYFIRVYAYGTWRSEYGLSATSP